MRVFVETCSSLSLDQLLRQQPQHVTRRHQRKRVPVAADDVDVMEPGRHHAGHHVADRGVDPTADDIVHFIEPGVIGHRAAKGETASLLSQEFVDVEREPMNVRRRDTSKIAD